MTPTIHTLFNNNNAVTPTTKPNDYMLLKVAGSVSAAILLVLIISIIIYFKVLSAEARTNVKLFFLGETNSLMSAPKKPEARKRSTEIIGQEQGPSQYVRYFANPLVDKIFRPSTNVLANAESLRSSGREKKIKADKKTKIVYRPLKDIMYSTIFKSKKGKIKTRKSSHYDTVRKRSKVTTIGLNGLKTVYEPLKEYS